jgi:hypothetical protein
MTRKPDIAAAQRTVELQLPHLEQMTDLASAD